MSRHEGTKTRGILFEKRLLRAFVCSWLIVTSGGLAAQEPPAAPRVSRLAKLMFVNAKDAFRNDLLRLADTKDLVRLMVAHENVAYGPEASAALRTAATYV